MPVLFETPFVYLHSYNEFIVSRYLYILLFVYLFSSLHNEHKDILLVVGKELHQIATELIEEFKELSKLPSINYGIQKVKELYSKVSNILFYYVYNMSSLQV
jgi:hypothetical protein